MDLSNMQQPIMQPFMRPVQQAMSQLTQPMQNAQQLYPAGEICFADSEADVQSVTLPPNTKRMYMSKAEPVFYIVATDGVGMKQVKAYDFVERPAPIKEEYATKADFNRLCTLLEGVLNHEPTVSTATDTTTAENAGQQ